MGHHTNLTLHVDISEFMSVSVDTLLSLTAWSITKVGSPGGRDTNWHWEFDITSDLDQYFKQIKKSVKDLLQENADKFIIAATEGSYRALSHMSGLSDVNLPTGGGSPVRIKRLSESWLEHKEEMGRSLNYMTYTGELLEFFDRYKAEKKITDNKISVSWKFAESIESNMDLVEKFNEFVDGSRPANVAAYLQLENMTIKPWLDLIQEYPDYDSLVVKLADWRPR